MDCMGNGSGIYIRLFLRILTLRCTNPEQPELGRSLEGQAWTPSFVMSEEPSARPIENGLKEA